MHPSEGGGLHDHPPDLCPPPTLPARERATVGLRRPPTVQRQCIPAVHTRRRRTGRRRRHRLALGPCTGGKRGRPTSGRRGRQGMAMGMRMGMGMGRVEGGRGGGGERGGPPGRTPAGGAAAEGARESGGNKRAGNARTRPSWCGALVSAAGASPQVGGRAQSPKPPAGGLSKGGREGERGGGEGGGEGWSGGKVGGGGGGRGAKCSPLPLSPAGSGRFLDISRRLGCCA